MAWQHARTLLAERGNDHATEAEIAQATADLLDRAEHGPDRAQASKRDRRVSGRTKAASSAGCPVPEPACDPESTDADDPCPQRRPDLAKVIPLGIFDPFEEARKRW